MSAVIQCPHCGERHREGSPDCLARWSGKRLAGRYQVGKVLGAGGMGAVHEAIRTADGLRVALKVLHPRYANDPIVVERFFREGREAGAIDHPGVVRIHEVGSAEDGAPFIAMELLEGQSLHHEIQTRGRLSPAEAAGWAAEALEALQAAHDKGIIHRDLKPANLFLARQPDGKRILKIVDFGLARVARESETRLTKTGVVMGTVAYMSPEQIRDFKSIDARSDVYSIGISLYEMLAGKTPLAGLTQPQAVLRIVTSSIDRSPRTHAPEVPDSLDAVVQRSLAPTPDGRFASARAMADTLRGLRLGESGQGERRTGPLLDARDLASAGALSPRTGGAESPARPDAGSAPSPWSPARSPAPAGAMFGSSPGAPDATPNPAFGQTQIAHTMIATDVRPGAHPSGPWAGGSGAAIGSGAMRPFGAVTPGYATPSKKSSTSWVVWGVAGVCGIALFTLVVVLVARSGSGDEPGSAGAQPAQQPPTYPSAYPPQPPASHPAQLQPLSPDPPPTQPAFPATLTPQ